MVAYSCSNHISLDLLNPDTVTFKIEPGNGERDKGEMEHAEIYIEVPAVKKECVENTKISGHLAGKHNVYILGVVLRISNVFLFLSSVKIILFSIFLIQILSLSR